MPSSKLSSAGLFAGIGGLELGFSEWFEAEFLCEWWEPARQVLRRRFPGVPTFGDINELASLPQVNVVCAGFPCTDLSQAGRTAGIDGQQSGLVKKALELVGQTPPKDWLVLENVRNMLPLHSGRAMTVLVSLVESLGYRWAYRVVDSRCSGVAQRRQRVFFVASMQHDPREVLFADDHGERPERHLREDAWGFYWTEGLRGLGWARDAIPTLKGGSTVGIPSPPAVWLPDAPLGFGLVAPSIAAAERLQGFRAGWTKLDDSSGARRDGARWKLVGNAVTVGVAKWLGGRLAAPGQWDPNLAKRMEPAEPWPLAAWGERGKRWRVGVSMWPVRKRYAHLADVLDSYGVTPLSHRGSLGFLSRLEQSGLRLFPEEFRMAVREHVEVTSSAA